MKCTTTWLILSVIVVGVLVVVIPGQANEQDDINGPDSEEIKSSLTAAEPEDRDEDAVVETEDEEDKAMYIKFADTGATKDQDLFKPTKEWQRVKPGQPIPKGLHVRYNLQTGVYEAKLLDKEEDQKETSAQSDSRSVLKVEDDESNNAGSGGDPAMEAAKIRMEAMLREAAKELELGQDSMNYWKEGDREGMVNLKKKSFSKEELREALKKFKAARDDVQDEKLREHSFKKSFRSYEELKKDFEQINMGVKTDLEILNELVESYKEKDISMSEKISILDEMEYLVHQVDNALSFVDMGGFDIVAKELNSTDPELRSHTLLLIGGAVQSNPKVQIHAVDSGVLHQLVRMLATETDSNLVNRVLYSSSSLLRHFPHAQNKFFQIGGLHALQDILSNSLTPAKVKVKILTLVNDLITERRLVNEHTDLENKQELEKLQQYSEVNIEKLLEELSWCSHLPPLLQLTEHDKREKVLIAMTTVQDICRASFTDNTVRTQLLTIKSEYEELSRSEASEDDKYFTGVLEIVDTLIRTIAPRKEEL